ncbi:MAG: DUF5916 domain-containing protein [Nannocystaceae bacterium]|nr:carbohydrate binding family 9 domain-containing protein [Myxococcales bacterium]
MLLPFLVSLAAVAPASASQGSQQGEEEPRRVAVGRARVEAVKLPSTRIDDDKLRIDGRVTEAAWRAIPPLPALIQTEPRYGAAPSQKTTVRVAYGARGIYAAFDCHDDPAKVRGQFSRKDRVGPSDRVWIEIDPNNDDRTGFAFGVNPSGAQEDAQLSRDDYNEVLWDGVWQAAAVKHDHGWSAEIFIPWSTLRFRAREVHTFGVNVGRWMNELGEEQRLSPAPQGIPGRLSFALDYVGVTDIEPGLNVELRPYFSNRLALQRPEGSLDRSWPVLPNGGADLKYALAGNLTLDLTVNPDFGQAEVDPAVLNLGPFEVFFPERRQFFLESKEIFETRFQLFYSRRVGAAPRPSNANLGDKPIPGTSDREQGELIGLDPLTRILGATRLTGQVAPSWSVGALTATTGPTFGVERYASGREYKIPVDPLAQYSVLRVRKEFDSQTYVGGIVTAVNRADGDPDAFTGGVDYRLRFRERWRHQAQVIGTHDGEEAGMGASSDVERTGKNVWVKLRGETLTPGANYNDLGYMRFANYGEGELAASVYNAQPVGKLRRISGSVSTIVQASYRGEVMRKHLHVELGLTTLKQWSLGLWFGGHLAQLDLYETRGNIPYEVPLHWWTGGFASTPDNKRVVGLLRWAYGEQNGYPGPDLGGELRIRPLDRLELTGSFDLNASFRRPRWVTESDAGAPVFARADIVTLTGVLRGTIGVTPTLTIQTYNQLLYSTARHSDFFYLTAPDVLTPIPGPELGPYDGFVDQGLTSLISNSILRWEYLPGSFFYAAFTHRTTFSEGGMRVAFSPARGFTNLVADGALDEDILFVKLVHLFGF